MAKAKVVEYCNERFKGSLDENTCNVLEQLIQLDKENGCVPDLRHIIYQLDDSVIQELIDLNDDGGGVLQPQYEKKHGTLRDEQTIGVAMLYYAVNLLLGDSVGLGKTVETAGVCNLLSVDYANRGQKFRYLFLTEKNNVVQIRQKMIKFTGEYVGLIKSGEAREIKKFLETYPSEYLPDYSFVGTHALLTTPEFIGWMEKSKQYGEGFPFDMLIVDESSILGNTTTKICTAYKQIMKNFKRIVFLNATPFETQLGIFYTQLSLLDSKLLPTKTNFNKEYCIFDHRGMYPRPTGKYKNQEQFKKLVGYRYFARTRKDKGAVMEDCQGGIILSDLSPIQKELLVKSQLHRMVFDCPSHLDSSIEFNMENVPKLRSLHDLIESDACIDADSILIFVHFKEAQQCLSKWLSDRGYSNKVLNGETVSTARQDIIDGFINHEFRILITNVQKGLDFGECNHCIFYSYDPNPSKMIQFEGRTTRSFDIIGKNVYILCSKGQEYKKLNDVVKQRAKATSELSNTDISVIMNILLGGME